MTTIRFKILITTSMLLSGAYLAYGQCADNSNIYSFIYDGKTYQVIKENKTWVDASACAVEKGGILIEINDVAEQNAIFTELNSNAGINMNKTVAPDGGGGSYVWIGGNDFSVEGNWVWDGDSDNNSTQFWMGTSSGSPVGGLYNNWGNEPDDYNGQDALSLSLDGWPLGTAGQWNDVDHANALYFVVEHPATLSIQHVELNDKIRLFPNPVIDFLTIEVDAVALESITILNSLGQELKIIPFENNSPPRTINLSDLNCGTYFIEITSQMGRSIVKKIVK